MINIKWNFTDSPRFIDSSAATHVSNDADTKRYLQRYQEQFANDKMFLQTYSNLNMMLNKNDDVKQNMGKNNIRDVHETF